MAAGDLRPTDLRASARLISLLRLLLLALALAALRFALAADGATRELWADALPLAYRLLLAVGIVALLLLAVAPWLRYRWQLMVHLVFDLLWAGSLIYLSGAVLGPCVPLLFAVVLTGNLVLPGVLPYVLPSLASLVLAVTSALYLAGQIPIEAELPVGHPLLSGSRMLGNLGLQVAALFVVDALGQVLARRFSEQRLLIDELIEQIDEGVLTVDRAGRVLYANATLARLLSLRRSPIPGDSVQASFADERLAPLLELLASTRLPAWRRLVTPDRRHLLLRTTALMGRRGRIAGRIMLAVDETRLRELEESAGRAERLAALGEMAAGIAHEVRNPLASMRGCAQELPALVEREAIEDARSLCGIMLREADRLGRLVEDFLHMSRLRPPRCEPLDLGQLLAETAALLRHREGPRAIEITTEVAAKLPLIQADPDQLRQVLANLAGNAVDAVAQINAPRIDLMLACEEPEEGERLLCCSVVDNGVGIPADRLELIFTPFHSGKSRGTGLGLVLAERIVRAHGGRIRIDSTVGHGTRVDVLLPIPSGPVLLN